MPEPGLKCFKQGQLHKQRQSGDFPLSFQFLSPLPWNLVEDTLTHVQQPLERAGLKMMG